MLINEIKNAFQTMLKLNGINQTVLAERLNETKRNCSRLLNKDDFKINNDIVKIAEAVGFDIEINFIDRKTGSIIKASTLDQMNKQTPMALVASSVEI